MRKCFTTAYKQRYASRYAKTTRNKQRRWKRNNTPLRRFKSYEDEVKANGGRIRAKKGD